MTELIVTMIIVAGVIAAGILTMRGYVPKQRLINSTDAVEKALSQAQYEATSRVYWTCLRFVSSTKQIEIVVDQSGDHGAANSCGNGNDYLIGSYTLDTGISLAACTSPMDGNPFDEGDGHVWFDTTGAPQLCSGGSCSIESLEFIISNSQLASGTRAREVEVSSSGLIEVVIRGEVGYNPITYAKTVTGSTNDGCE